MTGGIAAGKTTCAKILAEAGVAVHEADIIAKEFLKPESAIYAECLTYFGRELMHDHKKLQKFIFDNPKARMWLNNKIHPCVQAELLSRTKVATKHYHLLVVPLLFENNFDYGLDKIILVHSKSQLARAIQRDQASEALIRKIMLSQIQPNTAKPLADYLIDTDATDLQANVMQVHADILAYIKNNKSN